MNVIEEFIKLTDRIKREFNGQPHVIKTDFAIVYLDAGEVAAIIRHHPITYAQFQPFLRFLMVDALGIPHEDLNMVSDAVHQNLDVCTKPQYIDWHLIHTQNELYGNSGVVYRYHLLWTAYVNGDR